MTESELLAALDAHDELIRRCALGAMPYERFEAQYDSFHQRWALDGHESDVSERALLDRYANRISVHLRIWEEVIVRATSADLARLPASGRAGFLGTIEAQDVLRRIAIDGGLVDRD